MLQISGRDYGMLMHKQVDVRASHFEQKGNDIGDNKRRIDDWVTVRCDIVSERKHFLRSP